MLGRHYYQFSCSPSTNLSTIRHLAGGALQAGSLLLLQASTCLQPQVVAALGEWLATLMAAVAKAFSGKQSSIIFPAHSRVRLIYPIIFLKIQLIKYLSLSLSLPHNRISLMARVPFHLSPLPISHEPQHPCCSPTLFLPVIKQHH